MTTRIGLRSLVYLAVAVGSATGQTYRGQGPPPRQPAAPPHPTLQRRPPPMQALTAPFTLTPEQQAQLDQVLIAWEQHGARVKTFESKFTRWHYDGVHRDPKEPIISDGEVKYAAPDKGTFEVFGQWPEHWICDGKSIFAFDFEQKQLIESKLPPELQGKAIADGPLPFLFGAKADKLKKRYFLRIVPANVRQGQIMLEARPRFPQDVTNFQKAELILNTATMQPVAIQTYEPNGKTRTVYKFDSPKVNPKDPLRGLDPLKLFEKDPFQPNLPRGWTKIVEEPPTAQVGGQPAAGSRR